MSAYTETILITGISGFVGQYLAQHLSKSEYKIIGIGRSECPKYLQNLTYLKYYQGDLEEEKFVQNIFFQEKPSIVIHLAAISNADHCEENQDFAYIQNVKITDQLLHLSEMQNAYFLFLSTDFVFDGNNGPYTEIAIPNPINYYGKTKLLAESLVENYRGESAIIRTVMVYGKSVNERSNLLESARNNLLSGKQFFAVNDLYRTPTYIQDLVHGISLLISTKQTGIWNISGNESFTPYQMCKEMIRICHLDENLLLPISHKNFIEKAIRPIRTGLMIQKADKYLNYYTTNFKDSLHEMFS